MIVRSIEMDEAKLRELVRDSSEEYYLEAFKKLEDSGKNTWNWAAFGGGFLWFCYRKMFMLGVLYCHLPSFVIVGIAGFLAFSNEAIIALAITFEVFVRVLLGVFCNGIYYKCVKKNINAGNHLCKKYRPTSPVMSYIGGSWFVWPIAALIVWIRDRRLLRDVPKNGASFDNALDEKNIKTAIATKSEDHYMDKFREIEAGKIISLNWVVSFGSFGWFFYRKMYLYGSLFFIAGTLPVVPFFYDWLQMLFQRVLSPGGSLLLFNNDVFLLYKQHDVSLIATILLHIFMSLGGANHLYYRHLIKNKV
ncbi:hypothetical protein FACS189472_06070 [Alphaproteobacteria bacterium]|nr:hypothetical protein FACS189472_06070 [Alphaproteobacteria bacterium]